MTGQGRPSLMAFANARAKTVKIALLAAIALGFVGAVLRTANAQEQPPMETVRLRITWSGSDASRWAGRIRLELGSLSNLKLLGNAADSAGSIWLDAGQVKVASLSPRNSDSIEVTAGATDDAQVLIELSPGGGKLLPPVKVPLAQILEQPYVERFDNSGYMLSIERVPNETFRIATNRDPLIFAPGETFAFQIKLALAGIAPHTTLDFHATLSSAHRNEMLWSNEAQRVAVPVEGEPAIKLDVPLPKTEGVYKLRMWATRPSGFRVGFFPTATAPLAERTVEVVVLDTKPQPAGTGGSWETVLEIDPTNARWYERLPSWTQVRRIPGFNRGPLGSLRAGAVDLPLGRFVELPPTIDSAVPHWQAYSLPIEAAGTPHMLEINYPADEEQHFGASIIEPNAVGVVEGISRDSGVFVEGFGRAELNEQQTHRVLFWPRTQAPLLIVSNVHPGAAAHFGRIRVLKRSNGQLASGPAPHSTSERLVAAYLARPLAAETFGASRGGTSASGASQPAISPGDDWQTSYESVARLSDYLRYSGYNSAVVSVLADGSSIYPTSQTLPTPRYNRARANYEASERDSLELMLRIFDRDGLALLPALQFAAPLPELESLRRGSNPQTSGLEWIGPEGKTWLATYGTQHGLAPYYNLLDPHVQQAMVNVVRELMEKYGHHPALGGLAIQLSSNGFAQLPPLNWGLDDATIERFERDTGIQLVTGTDADRFAARQALLTGEYVEAWRSWRTEQVAQFYAQIAEIIRANDDHRRLVLTLEDSFVNPQVAARIRPNVLLENRVESTLLDVGIDRHSLEQSPGVVVCATRFVEPTTPLPNCATDLELNDAFAAWQTHAGTAQQPAALIYHRAPRRSLEALAARGLPFRIAGDAELLSQPLAQGVAVRQPYVRTIANNDPAVLLDGGELLAIGQEDVLRGVRSTLRKLPVAAQVEEVSKQPVVVRTYTEPSAVTLLVINTCPWHAEAVVTLDVARAATLMPLAGADGEATTQQRSLAPGQHTWPLSLEPYAVQAVRIDGGGVRVADVRAEASEVAKAEIAERLADLEKRDLTVPRQYQTLSNPSFEPLGGAAPVAGWRLPANAATAELDASNPQDGKTCLYFRCDDKLGVLESDAFPTPATGQLAMTAYVRDQQLAPGTELRMVFQAEQSGQTYRRSYLVPPPSAAQAAAGPWQYVAILVNDLPLESRGAMRVRFELSGPGEVWLDNVKLYDVLFPLKFYKYGQAEVYKFVQKNYEAKSAFDGGNVTDSVRLLERYWPRFLTAYAPLAQPAVAVQTVPVPQTQLPPPTDQGEQAAPGVSERIKRFVPFVK